MTKAEKLTEKVTRSGVFSRKFDRPKCQTENARVKWKTRALVAVGVQAVLEGYIEHTRLKWLGTILHMDDDRDLFHAVHEIYDTDETAGTLLEHAPDSTDFAHLAALAQSRKWNQHCKNFKFME